MGLARPADPVKTGERDLYVARFVANPAHRRQQATIARRSRRSYDYLSNSAKKGGLRVIKFHHSQRGPIQALQMRLQG